MSSRRPAPGHRSTRFAPGAVAGPVAALVAALLAALVATACTAAVPAAAPAGAAGATGLAPAAPAVTPTPSATSTPRSSAATPAAATTTGAASSTSPSTSTPVPKHPGTSTTPTPAAHSSAKPVLRVVARPIPYGPTRRAEMAAYAKRHYGVDSSTLHPKVIVLHFTAGDSAGSAIATFSRDTAALGELPGTCAHYVVDYSGVAYQLVPTTVMCRHAIGLNHVAIGIEVVQPTNGHSSAWADQQILARSAQVGGLLALVRSLQHQYGIPTSMVYGHATANSCPLFRDLLGWRNDHTDWGATAVTELRRRLDALP